VTAYADDADCGRCGKPVHLLHDPPCPHGWVACPECGWAAVCATCKADADREALEGMFREGGEWSPEADPWFNPEAREADAAYAERRPREDPRSAGTFRYADEEKQP
jgi:DNA-directed RNA polymerase subunit RPC12/RpoP